MAVGGESRCEVGTLRPNHPLGTPMSRLSELIRKTREKDPELAAELEREYRALAGRRAFGLNFERHRPEAVELPGRPVRKGDKVRILPERGSTDRGDQRLWIVRRAEKINGERHVHLDPVVAADDAEPVVVPTGDVVVVAEFKDPIYPGLVETGRVERGGDKPFHTVINAENFHALKALTFTHRGKVDAIYIDPPYNTGAKDWKYNNDYVEGDDLYRHSKWLAFMERRLLLAKELLNPDDSVLIVTIDEKEYLRLGLLLEQTFPEARIQMVASVIKAEGTSRQDEFSRTNEFIYFIRVGAAVIKPEVEKGDDREIPWRTLRRTDYESRRGTTKGGPAQFFPIYVDHQTQKIRKIGQALTHGTSRNTAAEVPGCDAVFPIRPDGTEMNWSLTRESLLERLDAGYVRVGSHQPDAPQTYVISYLKSGAVRDIETGVATVVGENEDGSVRAVYRSGKERMPTTVWTRIPHDAQRGGTGVLRSLLPDRRFPFPKSLYAIEDALRLFLAERPNAIVLDFFSGSGTTAHAVMRLNRQDGGRRQCISVTNNEVSADEQRSLRQQGLRPGDPEWEQHGICDYITKPRIRAAITGKTPDGEPIKGDYKFTDEFPMADGFEENAAFFTLTYESPVAVGHNRAFERIAPLLWLRAGAEGRVIEQVAEGGWDVADTYGVLFDLDQADDFCAAVDVDGLRLAFVVTDDDRRFQAVARRLPEGIEPVRLYESHLSNFRFQMGE